MTKDIHKNKLINPGNNIDKVVNKTIPDVAKVKISITSCVTDPQNYELSIISFMIIELIGRALLNYQQKLHSYKVNIRSAVRDKEHSCKCSEGEVTFDIRDESGQHTFPFNLGSPHDMRRLNSDVLTVEYDVGVIPINHYDTSNIENGFVNIDLKS